LKDDGVYKIYDHSVSGSGIGGRIHLPTM